MRVNADNGLIISWGCCAWVKMDDSGNGAAQGVNKVMALSAGMVETIAKLIALDWATCNNYGEVCIQTDCAEFVKVRKIEPFSGFLQPIQSMSSNRVIIFKYSNDKH